MAQERQIAVDAIDDWTALHSATGGIVLLPVRFETHVTPESGVRPQEAINRQLVRDADILIGMFWTKLGTPTGVAESGTVEEIDEFVSAGKPAMLYFSSRPIDPRKFEIEQYQKLKQFKEETLKNALVGSFSDVEEFRRILHRDLTNTVTRLRQVTHQANQADEAAALAQKQREEFEAKVVHGKFRTFGAARGILALSIVPGVPPDQPLDLGASHEQTIRDMLVPMRGTGGSLEYYGRSVVSAYPLTHGFPLTAEQSPMSMTELTDTGNIFAVDHWLYNDLAPDRIPSYRMNVYQVEITKAVHRYVSALRALGVGGILHFGMSMLKAEKFRLVPHDNYDAMQRGSSGDDVKANTIPIPAGADTSSLDGVALLLAPAFTYLWREAGFQSRALYGTDGGFRGFAH